MGGGGSFASCESESRERREAAVVKAVGKAFKHCGRVMSTTTWGPEGVWGVAVGGVQMATIEMATNGS